MKKTIKSKEQKLYNEYRKSRDKTLELSTLPNLYDSIRDNYSTTTELYDIVPKYVFDDQKKLRVAGKFLDFLTRKFIFKKKEMSLTIIPALVKTNGITKAFYPSTREEIIEDVLRKFATDPNRNEFLDNRLSVRFTLYELWKELKQIKHEYSYAQIRESLQILTKTNLEISNSDDKISFCSNMFETLGRINCNSKEEDEISKEEYSKKVIYFVRFNSLVSESIKNKTWRIINYKQCMSYKKNISRWLHKRISNMFLVGNVKVPYHILLSTIIRDSGMTKYSSLRLNLAQVEKCLEEMIKVGSIYRYEAEKIYDRYKQNKIEDVKFSLYISQSFYDDIQLNFLVKKDIQEVKQLQNKKNKNYNDLLQEFENSEETVIEVDSNNSITSEIKDILTSLNISSKDINKILSSKKNQKNLEQVKNNIITAKNYIEKKQKNNEEEECNNIAIVLASIKDNWCNNKTDEETTIINNKKTKTKHNTKTEEETEEDKKQKNLKTAKDYIKTEIKDKVFKKISNNLLKYFGPNVYIPWLSNLKFVEIKDDTLILSCKNGFIIDEIKRSYLNGVYRTEPDGSITWLRKGIKEVVEETEPEIKKIEIIKLSN